MYQIIKCYRSKKDYIHNTNFATLEFNFCKINHNPEYKEFANNYARGIVEGLRIKYAAPYVVVWEYDDNGENGKVIAEYGGQNFRGKYKIINK